jgi:hypothetical protein
MRRIRIAGLCLVAALATSVVAVAGASAALPIFNGPFPKPFKSASKATTIETVGKVTITCQAGTNAGEITGPKTDLLKFRFTGCATRQAPCSNANAAGEVVTNTLSGTLGYLNKAKREVGIDFIFPGAAIAEFHCGNLHVAIVGSIVGRIFPVDKKVSPPSSFILVFVQAGGKQKFTKLEGGSVDVLKSALGGAPLEESGLSSIDAITFAAPTRIKA